MSKQSTQGMVHFIGVSHQGCNVRSSNCTARKQKKEKEKKEEESFYAAATLAMSTPTST
jgi:hypothetical protein